MSNPYFWDFPQRNDTMYMSTIENKSGSWYRSGRQSTFQKKDIEGAFPKQQIPETVTRQNYSHSAHIQPRPENYKNIKKTSNPLRTDDIEFAHPQAVQFRTNRMFNPTNPLAPKYQLPSFTQVSVAPPIKFLRNTLDISDLSQKKQHVKYIRSPKNQKINGSQPSKLFKTIQAIPRLSVKDINNDGKFVSARKANPTDPLNPHYSWKDKTSDHLGLSFTKSTLDQEPKILNPRYGEVEGAKPRRQVSEHKKGMDFSLQEKDILGTSANSSNEMRLFLSKRQQFRDYMKTNDIEKTHASSLKKGISTKRNVNPLMPKYNYPQ